MKRCLTILFLAFICLNVNAYSQGKKYDTIHFTFCDSHIEFEFEKSSVKEFLEPLSVESINNFYNNVCKTKYESALAALIAYKEKYKPDDWIFYQLIRKTVQQISPKAENYHRYTLYKWFFLSKSGYDATLSISGSRILFYVQSNENIYNIPYRMRDGRQYVCLNYHDYEKIDFEKEKFAEVALQILESKNAFSYKITRLPDFNLSEYEEKKLQFNYYQDKYQINVKVNPAIKTLFSNYPSVDYESFFNVPLSNQTYTSLIPLLKKNIKGMSIKNGVDYLMRFTRYAFLFETDSELFGNEKRLTPEQTILNDYSDCEDRAALFFYLVKEIYDLPMIVLSYPKHISIAVKFNKPIGRPIIYNGEKYSVCEPTPQSEDLNIGQSIRSLKHASFEVVYAYNPIVAK